MPSKGSRNKKRKLTDPCSPPPHNGAENDAFETSAIQSEEKTSPERYFYFICVVYWPTVFDGIGRSLPEDIFIDMQGTQIIRFGGFWGFLRIFMWLFLFCGYAVIRIISFLQLPLFAKIPLILPNLSHCSVTIRLIFVISMTIFVCFKV